MISAESFYYVHDEFFSSLLFYNFFCCDYILFYFTIWLEKYKFQFFLVEQKKLTKLLNKWSPILLLYTRFQILVE